MSFLRQGQVREVCSVGDDVHKVMEIEQAGLKACPDREPGDDNRAFMQAA